MATSFTLSQIADQLKGELIGHGDVTITGVEALDKAAPEQITFVRDPANAHRWRHSNAGAAVIGPEVELEPDAGRGFVRVADADLGIARVLELFEPAPPALETGVHPSAVVHSSATLAEGVAVGPLCHIGPGVEIGKGTRLHGSVTILDNSQVGEDCVFWPGVVIRERTIIGNRCIFHANAVIGADGFGYRPDPETGGIRKIPQIGFVEIGDDCEIGANSCVDRGKFSATTLGPQCKLDNLVQVAHNCTLGAGVLIAAQTGLAGGVTVGDGCLFGGQVAVRPGTTIGKHAQFAAGTGVVEDVNDGEVLAGRPARPRNDALREHLATRKLPDLIKTVRQLQKQLDKMG